MITLERPRTMRDARAMLRTPKGRLSTFVLLCAIFSGIALLLSPPATVSYDAGVVADRSIKAPRSVSYVSDLLTDAERDRAAAAVGRVSTLNPAISVEQSGRLATTLGAIARVRADSGQGRDQRLAALGRLSEVTLSPQAAADVLDMQQPEWDAFARDLDNALRTLFASGLRPEQLEGAKTEAAKALPGGWTDRQKRAGTELLQQFVRANVLSDAAATQGEVARARAAVSGVQVQVREGEIVVREGSVVTAQDVEKLQHLGLVNAGIDWKGALGLLLWAVLIAAVLGLFIDRFAQEAWADDRKLTLVGLTLIVLTLTGRVLVPGHAVAFYFAPFAAAAMMLTVLVGGRTALATQIAGALHVGIMSGQVEYTAYVLVPALLGMAAVRRATTAREFANGSLNVVLGNLGVVGSFLLVGRATDVLGLVQLAAAAAISGFGSGLLAFAGMAILGHLLKITTVFELRELADPNHPLLRQLLLRTPGTYHHSLLVANLAERAAEVIGADPLVARVGAYYHDIGKMRNPSAFIENQTGHNPHDDLDSLVSAGIVSAHVRDGLALAERYHLPPVIREMIPGHHGTSVIRYFYQQARDRGQEVDEKDFRHPGPKPRSREAGIVMLADGTEASVRSLADKTQQAIRTMVEKIVGERVGDGQLDECELTLRDVQRIKEAFCELLVGVYHERIPYPEDRIARIGPASRTPPPAASGR